MKKIGLWLVMTALCFSLGCSKKKVEVPIVFTDVHWICTQSSVGCNPTGIIFQANGTYESDVSPTTISPMGTWNWIETNKRFQIVVSSTASQYIITKLTATELYFDNTASTNSFQYSR